MTTSSTPHGFELHIGRGWCTSESGLVKFVNKNDANGYYKALSLPPSATKEEIKAAYRRLVMILHPDLGGDEELFRFVSEIASVLLNGETKVAYDSVGDNAVYLGNIEREELARSGVVALSDSEPGHWACFTSSGFLPGKDTDAWIDLCWQVSTAVGYRGKIRVGVIEGGRCWPCDSAIPWGILSAGQYTFMAFQKGVEPNRLYALCAMIDWQRHLLNQFNGWAPAQNRKRT